MIATLEPWISLWPYGFIAAAAFVAMFGVIAAMLPERPVHVQPGNPQQAAPERVTRIGIVLVHGIGEQRRFQHLDSQMRGLIKALKRAESDRDIEQVTVDIAPSEGAAFGADQDSWTGGPRPSISVIVDHSLNGVRERTKLLVHEVWWADVNEPYSLAKQFRFWLWGLSVWAIPERQRTTGFGTADRVALPEVHSWKWWDRVRLWMVGFFFMLLGYSVGTASFLLTRLFNIQAPSLLRTFANYLSAIKLYNQERRYGPGVFWKREEFLDAVQEPPRVSIRRRMIRALADVAVNRYHRWYVLAHSQGTVVAFNGLMETAYSWPGYLDEKRWIQLKDRGMAGEMRQGAVPPLPPFRPQRPSWAGPQEICYRSRIFNRFAGFLTYGSPLQKFGGLWPALVPISRERAFRTGDRKPVWINVLDPLDPVSGRLKAYQQQPEACCPRPVDFSYAAHWVLLLAHLNYLTHRRRDDLASRTVRWMLTDNAAGFDPGTASRFGLSTWYRYDSARRIVRTLCAWSWWVFFAVVLAFFAGKIMPSVWHALVAAVAALRGWITTSASALWS